MKTHWAVNGLTFILGMLVNGLLLFLAGWLVYTYALKGYAYGEEVAADLTAEKPSREVEFVLEEYTSRADAAEMLEEAGLIPNKYYYQLELFMKNSSTGYQPGTYTLNQNMDTDEINIALRTPPQEEVVENQITIPEGFTIRDIATYLESLELMTAAEFIDACNTHDFHYTFLNDVPQRENRLEGYLFPDTYFLSEEPTADEVINKMLSRFDEIYSSEFQYQASELGLTMDEVVTMASIIEKEVRVKEERPMVSQVIFNRLEEGMALEMCSTVLYALDKRLDRLLLEDLQVQSPYNTYINPGLPVGPIANPGEDCLRAALFPEDGDYLFFVLQDEETGKHFFTDNFNDHVNAQEKYGQFY